MNIQEVPSENEIILECHDLKKSYPFKGKEIPVLKGVNLKIKKGESTAIFGRSGAGKSTLLGLLAGIDRQSSGSVIFEGAALEKLSNEILTGLRRSKIGIIFQNFNLLPTWTALENVEAALMHTGLSKTERRQKAKDHLTKLGLEPYLDNLPAQLSVGQQQRVAIARALVNEPTLIFADEPTGDLDPETAKEIIDLLLSLVMERKVTLFVTTHGNFPLSFAQKVYRLQDGGLTAHA